MLQPAREFHVLDSTVKVSRVSNLARMHQGEPLAKDVVAEAGSWKIDLAVFSASTALKQRVLYPAQQEAVSHMKTTMLTVRFVLLLTNERS
jgi:hypothetical protein